MHIGEIDASILWSQKTLSALLVTITVIGLTHFKFKYAVCLCSNIIYEASD